MPNNLLANNILTQTISNENGNPVASITLDRKIDLGNYFLSTGDPAIRNANATEGAGSLIFSGSKNQNPFLVVFSGGNVVLTPNARVGIGGRPSYPLHVYGTGINASQDIAAFTIDSGTSAGGNQRQVVIGYGTGALNLRTGYGYIQSIFQSVVAQTPFILNPNGGNVGVGNINPTALLDVNSHALVRGNLTGFGGKYSAAQTISKEYSILSTDHNLYFNNTTGIRVLFPSAIVASGQELKLKLINTGQITITGTHGQFFDGLPSITQSGRYLGIEAHSDGANWYLW